MNWLTRFFTRLAFWKRTPASRQLPAPEPFSVKSVSGPEMVPRSINGQTVSSRWTVEVASREALKKTTWVYVAIAKVATSLASAPLLVTDALGNELPNHPLQLLFNSPNEFTSQQDMVERLTYHLLLSGNGILSKNRGGLDAPATTLELWNVNPDHIAPVASDVDFISHYLYQLGSDKRVCANQDIVHVQLTDPEQPFWGLSPLHPSARVVDAETAAVDWNRVALNNRAVADGALVYDYDLSREQWLEARYQLREQHMGSDNARIPFVFGNSAKWQQLALTPVEMDFIESRRMTREEIVSTFGVPPILVGILDRATYSNYETARKAFWRDTIVPLSRNVADALTLAFNPDYPQDIRVTFDFSDNEVLSQLDPDNIDIAEKLWGMGVPFDLINERLRLGFDEFPGSNQSYIPTSVQNAAMANVDQFALTSGTASAEIIPERKQLAEPSELQKLATQTLEIVAEIKDDVDAAS